MSTKNPFANPDYPIDYNLRGRDVKPPANNKSQETITPSPAATAIRTYKTLEIQPEVLKVAGKKLEHSFPEGLEGIRRNGYERYFLPSELFSLIADGIEGKLGYKLTDIYADILWRGPEWLSVMMLRRGDRLSFYENPEGLVLTKKGYDFSNVSYSYFKSFIVAGFDELPARISPEALTEKNPELVEYLWSRPYGQLPEEIKGTRIYKMSEGFVGPVGFANLESGMIILFQPEMAARGVREKK